MSAAADDSVAASCDYCGRENPERLHTCTGCGTPLVSTPRSASSESTEKSAALAIVLAFAFGALGLLNVTRVFSGGRGDAGSEDLLTTALHEIGMSLANTSFIADSADGGIEITVPRPFAGTNVPLATNNFGVTSHIDFVADRLLMTGWGPGERVLPSTLDIIALAELSPVIVGLHVRLT